MRAEDTERDENEYQYLILAGNPSGSKTKGTSEGKAGKKPAESEGLSLSFVDPDIQKEESPPPKPVEPPAPAVPEEPDLALMAKQICEEMEQENEQQASGQETSVEQAPEHDGVTPSGEQTAEEPSGELPKETPEETPEEARIRRIRGIFEYVETFCVALGVMILLFMFVFRYVSVDGDSMLPTLHGGKSSDHADRLIISDFLYEPKTGDVVVISTGTGDKPLIKRVIATGGQTVRINFKTWEVYVDGVLLPEDYIWRREGQPMEDRDMPSMYGVDEDGICEFTVGEGKVFVMGDNRNDSKDSRFREIGEQDVEHILGKVILRLYPLGEFGSV